MPPTAQRWRRHKTRLQKRFYGKFAIHTNRELLLFYGLLQEQNQCNKIFKIFCQAALDTNADGDFGSF